MLPKPHVSSPAAAAIKHGQPWRPAGSLPPPSSSSSSTNSPTRLRYSPPNKPSISHAHIQSQSSANSQHKINCGKKLGKSRNKKILKKKSTISKTNQEGNQHRNILTDSKGFETIARSKTVSESPLGSQSEYSEDEDYFAELAVGSENGHQNH